MKAIAKTTFASVGAAVKAGWTIYDRTPDGYLIKQFFIGGGWKIGRVVIPTEGTR